MMVYSIQVYSTHYSLQQIVTYVSNKFTLSYMVYSKLLPLYQGRQSRSDRPSDRRTNVVTTDPLLAGEKPAYCLHTDHAHTNITVWI